MTCFVDQIWEDAGTPIQEELYGVTVNYCRRGDMSPAITAIGETTTYKLLDSDGGITVVSGRDYTLPVDSVVVSGGVIEPIKGDRIRETVNGVTHVYELLPLGNKPAAELLPGGFRWLLHTKRVS